MNDTMNETTATLNAEASAMSLNILNNNGIQRLVIATIKQAIADLKLLMQAGVIVNGKMSETLPKDKRGNPTMPRKVGVELTLPEARDTLNFFNDENIGVLLRLGGIEIEPIRFRSKLGLGW